MGYIENQIIMLEIDVKKTTQEIVEFIQKTTKKNNFKKVVIGLSGGIDSATALTCARLALGEENVICALLPYKNLHQHALERAQLIISENKIPKKNCILLDITPAVLNIASYDKNMSINRKGNIMARIRMIYLYDLAKKHSALTCGTENKSEYLLGYFTRHGDEASDLEPLQHLYKTQIFTLASHLKIARTILDTKPTAGLYSGQSDEKDFGFTYADADRILHLFYDKKYSEDQIIATGMEKKIVEKVLTRTTTNAFKHVVPYVVS